MRKTVEERFWLKVIKGSTDTDCWSWKASCCPQGYGYFWNGSRMDKAHRQSWIIHNGPIPSGLMVLHHCDNPVCSNPKHLFIGNQDDNMRDMVNKGRGRTCNQQGHQNSISKLSDADVLAIRKTYKQGGTTLKTLAEKYGTSFQHISAIIHGTRWGHLPL